VKKVIKEIASGMLFVTLIFVAALVALVPIGCIVRTGIVLQNSDPVVVTVDNVEVYRGPAYGVSISAASVGGCGGIVTVYGPGFFSWKARVHYAGHDVTMRPE
jgi:hypothetical protein